MITSSYQTGCRVFQDDNGNVVLDEGERANVTLASAYTTEAGSFHLAATQGKFLHVEPDRGERSCISSAISQPLTTTMGALGLQHGGADVVITPVTTLVLFVYNASKMPLSDTIQMEVQRVVKSALGITASVDVATYDHVEGMLKPVSAMSSSGEMTSKRISPDAISAFRANMILHTMVSLFAGYFAPSKSWQDRLIASVSIYRVVAALVLEIEPLKVTARQRRDLLQDLPALTLNLGDPSVLSQMLETVAKESDTPLSAAAREKIVAVATTTATIVSAVDTIMQDVAKVIAGPGSSIDMQGALGSMYASSYKAQTNITNLITDLANDAISIADFDKAAKVIQAADVVFDLRLPVLPLSLIHI